LIFQIFDILEALKSLENSTEQFMTIPGSEKMQNSTQLEQKETNI